jgi:hypothetical protein
MKFKQAWLKRQHDEIKHKKYTNVKVFKCTFEKCGKEFATSSKLQRHNLTHLKDKNFKCEYENCDAYFKRQYQLNSHLKLHSDSYESKQVYYKCHIKSKIIIYLLKKLKINTTYLIKDCRSKFKTKERLDNHKQNHTSILAKNENEEISENECIEVLPKELGENIYDKRSNENHNYSEFNETEKNIQNNNLNAPLLPFALNNNNNFSNLKQLEYKCTYCMFKFDSIENLNSHLKSHIDSKCLFYV